MKSAKNISKPLLTASILASLTLTTSAREEPVSQPMMGGTPLESQPTLSWTAEEGSIPLSGYTTEAVPPLDCDLPPDVFTSAGYIPEGTVYEYITDGKGNFILVDDQGRPVPIDEEMTQIPPLQDMISPQSQDDPDHPETFPTLYDDMGHEIQPAIGGDLLTEAFDPDVEPMPEGAFASPMTPESEPEKANWFVTLFQKFISLFSS